MGLTVSDSPFTLPELRTRLTDAQALTFTVYGEARGGPIEGRIAVGSVIRNRTREKRKAWGTTTVAVCLAHAQFSCWYLWGGEANYRHLQHLVGALLRGGPVPWTVAERAVYTECCWVTEGLLSDFVQDRVSGATHYYAPAALPEGIFPNWAVNQTPVADVGGHLFFKGIA